MKFKIIKDGVNPNSKKDGDFIYLKLGSLMEYKGITYKVIETRFAYNDDEILLKLNKE